MRWVMLLVPESWDKDFLGPDPCVIHEAPKGVGREVRLATEDEVGRFGGRPLLPPAREETP